MVVLHAVECFPKTRPDAPEKSFSKKIQRSRALLSMDAEEQDPLGFASFHVKFATEVDTQHVLSITREANQRAVRHWDSQNDSSSSSGITPTDHGTEHGTDIIHSWTSSPLNEPVSRSPQTRVSQNDEHTLWKQMGI